MAEERDGSAEPATKQVGDLLLYEGGTWPAPAIPYEEGEEAVWDTLTRGWGPIPPASRDQREAPR